MKNNFWNKKIPSLLGILIIILGLTFTTFLTNKQSVFQIAAEENAIPQDVRITNVTSTSFTVSYKTSELVSGYINYGQEENLDKTAFNELDKNRKLQDHNIHSITVDNLTPQTQYHFNIVSDGQIYLNNDKNFEVNTAKTITSTNINMEINGKVILPDASIPKEAIVYLTSQNSQVLSTLINPEGTFSINLTNLLDSSLSEIYTFNDNSIINLLVVNKDYSSRIVTNASINQTIPTITLSNDYDFEFNENIASTKSARLQEFPLLKDSTVSPKLKSVIKTPTSTPSPTSEPEINENISEELIQNEDISPEIITPEKNQIFYNTKPEINGIGIPNKEIKIEIHSNENIKTSVMVDSEGNWSYTPTKSLSPGQHTITITTPDASGILKTITQSFTVYAQEISLTPTAQPTLIPTPTVVIVNEISPTTTPTLTTAYSPTLPPTGNASLITAGIIGLLITIVGGLIFLLSRKGF